MLGEGAALRQTVQAEAAAPRQEQPEQRVPAPGEEPAERSAQQVLPEAVREALPQGRAVAAQTYQQTLPEAAGS